MIDALLDSRARRPAVLLCVSCVVSYAPRALARQRRRASESLRVSVSALPPDSMQISRESRERPKHYLVHRHTSTTRFPPPNGTEVPQGPQRSATDGFAPIT